MSSDQSTQADSTLSEFSSSLLNVDTEGLDVDETIVDISSSGYESLDNNHLSSVLSQIQDEGPAYDELQTPDDQSSHATSTIDESNVTTDYRQDKPKKNDGVSKKKVNPVAVITALLAKLTNHAERLQVALILVIAVVTSFMLFGLESRTSSLELTMVEYEDDLQEAVATRNESLEPKVFKINKALTSVKEKLQLVETKLLAFDKKYEAAANKNIAENDNETLAIKNNAKVIEGEILALKAEVNNINNNFKTINDNRVVSETYNASKGLTVSLASLTNMDKVNELVKKLYITGLWPAVEKATVKGKHVYRISVSGFADVKAAKLFINNAGKQYGTAGARIRKS